MVTRLLCRWDFLGKSTGVGCLFLLQGTFRPRDRTQVSRIVDRRFTVWATREILNKPQVKYEVSSPACLFFSFLFPPQFDCLLKISLFSNIQKSCLLSPVICINTNTPLNVFFLAPHFPPPPFLPIPLPPSLPPCPIRLSIRTSESPGVYMTWWDPSSRNCLALLMPEWVTHF